MSLAINIIIPVVQNRLPFEEQNVFMPISCSFSLQKEQNRSEGIIWKKSISAFKRFREKRERKDLRKGSQFDGNAQQQCKVQKKYFKLVRRSNKDIENDSQIKLSEYPKSFYNYFDPNIAPLYQFNLNQPLEMNEKMVKQSCNTKQMEGQFHQIKNQRVQSQIVEQFIPVEVIIQPRDDDPFLIVRRESISKNSKAIKTKLIKKNKSQKGKAKDSCIYHSAQKNQIRKQKQPNFNLNQNISIALNKDSQSLSDSEPEYRTQLRIRGKKSIQTLQELLRLSQQMQQIQKLPKQRETIIITESLQQKQKFQIVG